LNNSIMMSLPTRTIPTCRKGCDGQLESRIVRDVELPIRAETLCAAVLQIAIGYAEELLNLEGACFVRDKPTLIEPVFEAHPPRL
jgi:hypothetical protein